MINGEASRESSQTLNMLKIISLEHIKCNNRNLRDSLVTSHEYLSIVLIQSTLVVTDSRHILDNDSVVRMLALLVENRVGFNHVINNVGLGDFLGAELLLRAEILSIVVTEMIVAGNGSELDTSADQEVDQCRLHLGLTRLEIITSNECIVLLGKFNSTRNKCVLWGTVDKGNTLKNTSYGEDSGGGNLLVTVLDCLHEILGSVIDTRDKISKTLSVGSPLNNDLVQVVRGLEVAVGIVSFYFLVLLEENPYRISLRICSTCSMQALLPFIRLSARSS
jgi:hypothetical protein